MYPGEWVCSITYSTLGCGKVIKFKIIDWDKSNIILDYNAPCQKDDGFFFFPISQADELISIGKCSETDIVLDLWLHTIYRDRQVTCSFSGPVVYFRNSTGNPMASYAELGARWDISKATSGRVLKKLAAKEYLTLIPLTGRQGTIIYLNNYLSTMFNISDVMIDKEEIAMTLNLRISIPDKTAQTEDESLNTIRDEQFSVSETEFSVSKSHIKTIMLKAAKVLSAQGVACCSSPKSIYKLLQLSPNCKENISLYEFQISCGYSRVRYRFELKLKSIDNLKNDKGVEKNDGK